MRSGIDLFTAVVTEIVLLGLALAFAVVIFGQLITGFLLVTYLLFRWRPRW